MTGSVRAWTSIEGAQGRGPDPGIVVTDEAGDTSGSPQCPATTARRRRPAAIAGHRRGRRPHGARLSSRSPAPDHARQRRGAWRNRRRFRGRLSPVLRRRTPCPPPRPRYRRHHDRRPPGRVGVGVRLILVAVVLIAFFIVAAIDHPALLRTRPGDSVVGLRAHHGPHGKATPARPRAAHRRRASTEPEAPRRRPRPARLEHRARSRRRAHRQPPRRGVRRAGQRSTWPSRS